MTKQFTCPGCSQPSDRAAVGAIARFNGQTHQYMLCPKCAKRLERDPNGMADRIELALTRPQGSA